MKSRLLIAGAISSLAIAAAVPCAIASPTGQLAQSQQPTVKAWVTPFGPKVKGSTARPSNLHFSVKSGPALDLTIGAVEIQLPKQVVIRPQGFSVCSPAVLAKRGASACPRNSKAGTGTASAALGANKTHLPFKLTLFTSGKNALTLYLESNALRVPIPVKVLSKGSAGQKLTIQLPKTLQSPLTGTYAYLKDINANLALKGGKKSSLVSTSGCPKTKKYAFASTLKFVDNPLPAPVPSTTVKTTAKCLVN